MNSYWFKVEFLFKEKENLFCKRPMNNVRNPFISFVECENIWLDT